jgi:hypothetical protein
MKARLPLFILQFFFLIIVLALTSCVEEDIDKKEHLVETKVYSNTPGALITLQYHGLIIKDYWYNKVVTQDYFAQVYATCDDPTVLITAEIYVDGKLKAKKEANSYVNLYHRIKGNAVGL